MILKKTRNIIGSSCLTLIVETLKSPLLLSLQTSSLNLLNLDSLRAKLALTATPPNFLALTLAMTT
ncbi:unnamed protein product [Staurois parvus]|uniref:Uncharacterized protein n=1 Tax=Staurois parvus TaxID=386267 RepID=A0ABN9G823_9NEOB|nr:unnamed protein product [Staurois parvus]